MNTLLLRKLIAQREITAALEYVEKEIKNAHNEGLDHALLIAAPHMSIDAWRSFSKKIKTIQTPTPKVKP